MYRGGLPLALAIAIAVSLGACGTLVAPYDDTVEQGLNKLSDDTAKFIAADAVGGPELSIGAKDLKQFAATPTIKTNEISSADAKMYVQNAQLPLMMCIANTSEIVLSAIHSLADNQSELPHFRWASESGKSPTTFFLRAS